MAQHKPEEFSLDKVLELVSRLSADEQEQLRIKLNRKKWGDIGPSMARGEAIELFSRWMSSSDAATVEEWDQLKRALDEDRLSDRKLFNE